MATRRWHFYRRFGRLQFRVHLLRHRYVNASDRWVVQPALIYDRKEPASER